MNLVDGGCCAAKGFLASGIHSGIRRNATKKDLALIFAECECNAAAVYTTNLVKADPLYLTMENLKNKKARGIVANSGNANACAPNGRAHAEAVCSAVARELGIDATDLIVNSTGVIGVELPVSAILDSVPGLVAGLKADGSDDAAQAIMTTDLAKKEIAVEICIEGKTVTVGGIAKGSGMIHPNMATMLSFLTTDCCIAPDLLEEALRESCRRSYNRITVDGDTSTNDMTAILASGLAGNAEITEKDAGYWAFVEALDFVNVDLAKKIAKDGEGATKLICCRVLGAAEEDTAEKLAKSVVGSSLVKAAMFGADANCGRVLCALGYAGAAFNPKTVDVSLVSSQGEILVCQNGLGILFDETLAKQILLEKEICIVVDLHTGEEQAEAFGCDLTYDYVKINGDYRS